MQVHGFSRIVAAFLVALPLCLTGCRGGQDAGAGKKAPVVRFLPVEASEVTDYEFFTGRTEAVESVEVRARVTGYLDDVLFKPGSEVKKDKELFLIDPRPYKATLDQANSQIALAEAKAKLAVADLARAKELAKTPGAISQQDMDKYAAAQNEAEASVKAAKANAEIANLNYKFTKVTAPVDGIVGRNFLTLGNLVTQDHTLLTTIVSMDPMYAYFDVDERTMLRIQDLIRAGKVKSVKDGDKVVVEFSLANEGDRYPHKGTLDFVNNQVDGATGTIQVRGIFANPAPEKGSRRVLTPGLFVRVRLQIGEPYKALVVPQSALGTDQGQKYLLVVNDKNTVEYRPITLGAQQGGGTQVVFPMAIVRGDKGVRAAKEGEQGEASLQVGDRIIVSGLQRVRPGVAVEPKAFEPEVN